MAGEDKTSQYEKRRDATEEILRQALERLKKGNPTHPQFQQRRYRLNVSTLAKEAGTSRNVIYDNHRGVLKDLRAAAERRSKVTSERVATADDKIAKLQKIICELKRMVRQLATNNAVLQARVLDAERERK